MRYNAERQKPPKGEPITAPRQSVTPAGRHRLSFELVQSQRTGLVCNHKIRKEYPEADILKIDIEGAFASRERVAQTSTRGILEIHERTECSEPTRHPENFGVPW
jgi:hypothetical protein